MHAVMLLQLSNEPIKTRKSFNLQVDLEHHQEGNEIIELNIEPNGETQQLTDENLSFSNHSKYSLPKPIY
jgi:hypothetical protein